MRRESFVILLVVLFSVCKAQGMMFGGDWMKGLFDNINQMQENLQGNIRRMNEQIQENVRAHLQQSERMGQMRRANIGEHTMAFGTNGQSFLMNGGAGGSRTVISGSNPQGETYFRDSEDKIVGDTLHHVERVYNPSRRAMDEYKYTLDLKDPNAKPVPSK